MCYKTICVYFVQEGIFHLVFKVNIILHTNYATVSYTNVLSTVSEELQVTNLNSCEK